MDNNKATKYVPAYADEIAISRHFVNVLEQRLAGKDRERAMDTLPVDWCHIGVLGPWKQDVAAPESDELPLESTNGSGVPETGQAKPSAPAQVSNKPAPETNNGPDASEPSVATVEKNDDREGARRPPSSLGFEILMEPDADGVVEFSVEASLCIFTKHLPSYIEQKSLAENAPLAEVAQRWPISVPSVVFSIPVNAGKNSYYEDGIVQAQINEALEVAAARPDIARLWPGQRPKVTETALQDQKNFEAWLQHETGSLAKEHRALVGNLEVRCWPRADGKVRIGCYLRNDTPCSGTGYEDAFRIFGDARLSTKLVRGKLHPIEILPVPQDYQYDRRVWAVGHNTSVRVTPDHSSLKTEALARYEQVRVVTQDQPTANFDALANDPFTTLEIIRLAMTAHAEDWDGRIIKQNALGLGADELRECAKDLEGFKDEINRFACGIAALNADSRLLDSFKGMNGVFRRLAKGYTTWRLFQLVFIVTQLPALAVREGKTKGEWPAGVQREWSDILDWGDVLWFRTGGGKTEAYLGLTCCAILYDRLRGKSFGTTAWLRFPLRMLSVQQLQRAMRVIWETEKERKTLLGDKAAQSDPIRLGYFVGGTTTPNTLNEDILKSYSSEEGAEKLRVVPDCPECGGSGTVKVVTDPDAMRFRHICSKCQTELPLDISDDEVYRHLPSLLVGTIDKMATIGLQVKYGILWGAARWRCPKHGYAFGDYCFTFGCDASKNKKNRIAVSPYDPSPALHIQDELHLLQEELGAFSGHYETLIRYCEETLSGKPSKVVAATATIEGFEHQVRHLYGVKGARRFPGRGHDRLTSFYAQPDRDAEKHPRTARIFVAFRSASMHAADASALCTEIFQSEVNRLMQHPHDALAFLQDAKTEDDVRTLLYYYTTTLNYVGSLQRGSRVSQALEGAAGRTREKAKREMTVEYHSSRSTGAQVADLVHRVENPPSSWDSENFLDALVATSMISHGVDLERINLMTMDGVPEETAEYIQASSRSGRKHVGLIVVVLPAYSLRATSIYHRFLEYHDHLDRMVSPVPVNRFAKYAARRTLPGVAIGLIYGHYVVGTGNQNLKKRHEADNLLNTLGDEAVLDKIYHAYALGKDIYDEGLERGLKDLLAQEMAIVRMSIRNSHEPALKDVVRPAPMLSLRDVEVGVPLNPDVDHKLLLWLRATKD